MSDVTTFGGRWRTDDYKKYRAGAMRGCEVKLLFAPNDLVDSPKIGLTQSVTPIKNRAQSAVRPEVAARSNTEDDGDAGRYHDRAAERTNPIYGMNNPTGADRSLGSGAESGNSHWGKRVTNADGTLDADDAWLWDQPKRSWADGDTLSMTFETTALAVEGAQNGTYYGSVEWGFRVGADDTHELLPFRVVSMGTPTRAFLRSAQRWNDANVDIGGTATASQDLPTTRHAALTPAQLRALSDDELARRVETLDADLECMVPGRPDYQNKLFEKRALERELSRRSLQRYEQSLPAGTMVA